MNRPAFVFLLWGLELAALTLVGIAIFGFGTEPPLLLGGAAATSVAIAGYLAARRVDARRPEEPLPSPDLSPAAVWLALSVVLLAVGAELGLWLALISAGMLVAGAIG